MKTGIKLLAWRMMVDNKKRSFVISAAVCLTAVLFTTILSIATHTMKSDQIFKQMYAGSDFHGGINGISMEEAEDIVTHELVEESYVISEIGYLIEDVSKSNNRVTLYTCDDAKVLDHMFITLIQGQYPTNEDEILLDIEYINTMNLPATVGSQVLLDVEENGITQERTYTLSGYYSDATFTGFAPKKAFVNIPKFEDISVYFMLANSLNIDGKVKKIWYDLGKEGSFDVNYAYTFSKEEWFDLGSILALIFILFIVFMSGFLLIYNIYGMTLARDVRIYGLMKTIGTTSVQLRKIILYHTNFIYVLSIPFGLGLGYFIGGKILTPVFMSLSGLEISFEYNWIILVFTLLFTYFTTIISAIIPVKRITRISCIMALKGVSTGRNGGGEKRAIYGAKPFYMAISNLCREPKKNILMIGSISLSIILFLFVSTFVDVLSSSEKFQVADFCIRDDVEILQNTESEEVEAYEVTYHIDEVADEAYEDTFPSSNITEEKVWYRDYDYRLSEDIIPRIKAIEGVEKVIPIYSTIVVADVEKLQAKIVAQGSNQQANKILEDATLIQGKTKVYVCGIPEEAYEYLSDGILRSNDVEGHRDSPDINQLNKGGYAIVGSFNLYDRGSSGEDHGPVSYYLPKELISLNVLKKQYEVLALGQGGRGLIYHLLALDHYPLITLDICLSYEDFIKEFQTYDIEAINVFVRDGSHDTVKAKLSSLLSSNAKINDKRAILNEYQKHLGTIQIVGYSLSLIVFLIGILNYVNTVVCGMYERRRELALLEIIGMTSSQMRRMLFYESGCYIGIATLICLIAGLPLTLWVSKQIFEVSAVLNPIPLIVMIGFIIVIALITVNVTYKGMLQLTPIERLHESE